MPDAPLVTVLVTSLNRPQFLREACNSVLGQTLGDLELLICDDASDDSGVMLTGRALAEQDGRVQLIQNPRRLGQFHSILAASKRIRGRFFAILNDDDAWEPEFLEALVTPLLSDPGLAAAFCDHYLMDETGSIDEKATDANSARYNRVNLVRGRYDRSSSLLFGVAAFPTVVASIYRTSAVDWDRYHNASMNVIGFYDLWLQVCTLGDDVAVWYESQRLSRYRIHGGQLSSERSIPLGRAMAWILEEALDGGTLASVASHMTRRLALAHRNLGTRYLRRGDLIIARSYLWRACLERPRARVVAGLLLTFDRPIVGRVRAWVLRVLAP